MTFESQDAAVSSPDIVAYNTNTGASAAGAYTEASAKVASDTGGSSESSTDMESLTGSRQGSAANGKTLGLGHNDSAITVVTQRVGESQPDRHAKHLSQSSSRFGDQSSGPEDTHTDDEEPAKSGTLERVSKAFAPYVPLRRKRRSLSQSSSSSLDDDNSPEGNPTATAAEPHGKNGVREAIIRKLSLARQRRCRTASGESSPDAGDGEGTTGTTTTDESDSPVDGTLRRTSAVDSTPARLLYQEIAHVMEYSEKRNRSLHRLFPELPESETHVDDYSCALQKEILIHGRLYLTSEHFCFNANIFGYVTNLVIPITDVVSIEKKSVLIIPNALLVTLKGNKQYFFASFVKRDEAYLKMLTLLHAHRKLDAQSTTINPADPQEASSSATLMDEIPSDLPPPKAPQPDQTLIMLIVIIVGWSLVMTLTSGVVLWRVKNVVGGLEILSGILKDVVPKDIGRTIR
ncbi:uncharacterized protein SPPG_06401 [Spizellomyces punctatus DAOM BR117]|uniref:GRAM domain-containing protein n=1 Tax=Spizellomyces punctatus (strain DAOM BR117) TaxID=645134 RepID=A0A0L0HCT5_SPIPD|nr:uncharacterized protein SPPG_06401 [Spizellomyces punctatus DAOM BR117]KNC98724.1 hypothetical protein SPPG_06401 [Spizellomyces punctatus DAOM BR117]|eukprot:XP_016606764.1 hypothetical protein SPPG_06401 [Spizellomyces punctatus DAOM BR117]